MSPMHPFALTADFTSGALQPHSQRIVRRLSDMRHLYADEAAYEALLARGNPVIYEVQQHDVPNENGHLLTCTTVIHAGRVGNEFFMTKGHFHARRDTAEYYFGLSGRGKLLMEADGEFKAVDMAPGVLAYIPPYWAHRTLNTGSEPFIFLSVWPADAGHNYADIEDSGFAYVVVADGAEAKLIPNPNRK